MAAAASIDRETIERIVRQIVYAQGAQAAAAASEAELVVSISARHVHLSDEHVECWVSHDRPRDIERSGWRMRILSR